MKTIVLGIKPLRSVASESTSVSGSSRASTKSRRKAIRTAKFWSKMLGIPGVTPDPWLMELAAKLEDNPKTSYSLSSLILGMMLHIRATTGDSAAAKAKAVSAVRQWI